MHADTQLTHREEHVGTGLQRLFIVGGGGGDGVGVCVTCGEETRLGISGDSHHPSVHFDTYDGVEWGIPTPGDDDGVGLRTTTCAARTTPMSLPAVR